MEIKINDKLTNQLLNRTRVEGTIVFEGATPDNKKIVTALAKELGKEEQLVMIKHVYSDYGVQKANFNALVYDNKEAKLKGEMMTKHLRKKAEEESKKSAENAKKKAEEEKTAAAKPAEEKKEGEQ